MISRRPLIVQKYGGSSLNTPEKVKAIAKGVRSLKEDGNDVVVVVSAIGDTTNELISLSKHYSRFPLPREMDLLLSAGERMSMALMAMTLHDVGCPAISFTGSQAGIITDEKFSNASILEIRPTRLPKELEAGKVIVLAGFQGVSKESKEVTTLGRGGSDTTAVALASHFKALRCEFRKDVQGVFTEDPKLHSQAKLLAQLSFEELYEMCLFGAKIVHSKAVRMASQLNVPMHVCKVDSAFDSGTLVNSYAEDPQLEFVAINRLPKLIRVQGEQLVTRLESLLSHQMSPQIDILHRGEEQLLISTPNIIFDDVANLLDEAQVRFEVLSSVAKTFRNQPSLTASAALGLRHTQVTLE